MYNYIYTHIYIGESIPVNQTVVKDLVTSELKEWLAKVREISREIGSMAMQHMQERQERWRMKTVENPKLKNLQHHNVNSAIEMVVNEGLECKLNYYINIWKVFIYVLLFFSKYDG